MIVVYNDTVKVRAFRLLLLALMAVSCGKGAAPPPPASLQISVPYEVDTLDPHAKARRSNFATSFNFYEPLVRTSANMRIEPCLARDWENPDVNTWIFHLQPGVHFHNGQPMTSLDVEYSFDRLLKSRDLEVSANLSNVSEVAIIDNETIRVRTSSPVNVFLNKISFVSVIPRNSTGDWLSTGVNGTGSYTLKEWKKGEYIRMERNNKYWGKPPAIPMVEFRLSRTPEEASDDLVSGRSQMAQVNSKVLEEKAGTKRFLVIIHDSQFVKYLSYDMFRQTTPYCSAKTNPFRNPLVRQALNIGIDRDDLVKKMSSYALPTDQPVPPFVFGYNPRLPPLKYDPELAKTLLAKAGFPGGFEVTLLSRQIARDAGVILTQQLSAIGIRVTLKVLPDPEYFQAVGNNDFSFILNRLASTMGDASDILEGCMHSKDADRHFGSMNYAEYNSAEVDAAIERSAGIMKEEERRNVLEGIMGRLMQDLPWIPLFIDQEVYGLDKRFAWQPRHDGLILASEIKEVQ